MQVVLVIAGSIVIAFFGRKLVRAGKKLNRELREKLEDKKHVGR